MDTPFTYEEIITALVRNEEAGKHIINSPHLMAVKGETGSGGAEYTTVAHYAAGLGYKITDSDILSIENSEGESVEQAIKRIELEKIRENDAYREEALIRKPNFIPVLVISDASVTGHDMRTIKEDMATASLSNSFGTYGGWWRGSSVGNYKLTPEEEAELNAALLAKEKAYTEECIAKVDKRIEVIDRLLTNLLDIDWGGDADRWSLCNVGLKLLEIELDQKYNTDLYVAVRGNTELLIKYSKEYRSIIETINDIHFNILNATDKPSDIKKKVSTTLNRVYLKATMAYFHMHDRITV